MNPDTCSECGAKLSASEQDGLCAHCLLVLALSRPSPAVADPLHAFPGAPDPADPRDGTPPRLPGSPFLRQFGPYELLEEIARGGMGVVYKARQPSLGRLVAVKMILFGSLASPDQVRRFRIEASAAGCLQHPNIVAVHDVGLHEDQHYLVMDYVDGPNLSQIVGHQPLSPARAARYLRSIADAIRAAHERGILHRDLKPSNVLIDPANDQPRVTDFGLAKRFGVASPAGAAVTETGPLSWDPTLTGEILGSPSFMAPEQAAGRKGEIGRATDVYGLGAILYHLLTARPPFQGESLAETLQQLADTEPPPPRLLNPRIPPDLETICLKCLEKDPENRYPTARALVEELDRFLHDEPIHARPIRRPEIFWRWCRRRPAVAIFGGATALLLMVLAIGAPIAAFHIDRNAKGEARERSRAEHNLYAAEMNLAQEALNGHNLGLAWRILERWNPGSTVPGTSPLASPPQPGLSPGSTVPRPFPDLRNWEWRYLRSRCHGDEVATLTDLGSKHRERVASLAFSPDGQWLASGSHDGKVKLFHVVERREDAELPHPADVRAVAFSARDRVLATLCMDGFLRFWDLDRKLVVASIPAHTTLFGSPLAISADGSLLAYCEPPANNGYVIVTNLVTKSSSRVQPYAHGNITRLAFSPDGRTLAMRDYAMESTFVDLSSGQRHSTGPHRFFGDSTMAYSPDGQKLVTTSKDRTAKIWESATGRLLGSFTARNSYPCAALFLADSRTLAVASAAHTITLWNCDSGQETATYQGHRAEILALALSPDGTLLASGSADGEVKLWSTTSRSAQVTSALFPVDSYYELCAFSPNARTFAVLRLNRAVEIWDSATLTRTKTLRLDHPLLDILALSSEGRLLASAGGATNLGVKLWRLDTDPPREELSLPHSLERVDQLEFSADGKMLAIAGRPGRIELWHVESGQRVHTLPFQDVLRLAFSPGGDLIAAVGENRNVKLWNVADGREKWERMDHQRSVAGLAFHPDGRTLFTGSADRTTMRWDVESGRPLTILPGQFQGADSVAVSPDGLRVAVGTGEGTIRLWKMDGPEPREVASFRCLGSMVNRIAFLPDGNTLVAHSYGAVETWHAPSFPELTESAKP